MKKRGRREVWAPQGLCPLVCPGRRWSCAGMSPRILPSGTTCARGHSAGNARRRAFSCAVTRRSCSEPGLRPPMHCPWAFCHHLQLPGDAGQRPPSPSHGFCPQRPCGHRQGEGTLLHAAHLQEWVRIAPLSVEQPRGAADGVLALSPGRALAPADCCEGRCPNTAPQLEANE